MSSYLEVENDQAVGPVQAEQVSLRPEQMIFKESTRQSIVVVQSLYETTNASSKTEPSQIAGIRNKPKQLNEPAVNKRLLVKEAALAYGIDWRILEALWQVESGKQLITSTRSVAGAQGPLQFMPQTWRRYAKDGNGDGHKDINDARDALYAAADLLAQNGLKDGEVRRALLRYNNAEWFVWKVTALAYSLTD